MRQGAEKCCPLDMKDLYKIKEAKMQTDGTDDM